MCNIWWFNAPARTFKFANKFFSAIDLKRQLYSLTVIYILFICFYRNFLFLSPRSIFALFFTFFRSEYTSARKARNVCDRYARIRAPDLVWGRGTCRCLYKLVAVLNRDVLRTPLHCELLSPGGYALARRFN